MTQTELTALIRNARTGDGQAQEILIQEIQDRVYYHCRKMIKNESDAQDAAQDVLITVLTSLDKLREPAAFYGWVNGITANRCKHMLTQGVREWQIPEDEDGGSMLDDLEDLDQQAVPDAVLENKETQRLMMEIIDALPPVQRMSVLFYYYDEMSIKDIAQAMETSEGTVKSRLSYARRSIKEGVEKLEKQGTKLYGIAPLPLLLLFLRREAAQSSLSEAQSARLISSVLSAVQIEDPISAASGAAANETAAAGTAAGGAAAKAGLALGTRIVIGILAAAAAVGAVFGALHLTRSDGPEEPSPPVQAEEPLPERLEPPAEEEPAPAPPEPPEDEGPSQALLALLNDIVYYGDPSQCKLTPEQAAVFAEVIHQETHDVLTRARRNISLIGTGAALFDVGDGTPALFFGGGLLSSWAAPDGFNFNWTDVGTADIWQYQDGKAVPYAPEGQEPGGYWGQALVLRDGSLFIGGQRGSDGSKYDGGVYPLTNGTIPVVPQTSAGYETAGRLPEPDNFLYYVDGAEATEEEFASWRKLWADQEALCGHSRDGGVGGSFFGLGDAAAAAEALERYAGSGEPEEPAPAAGTTAAYAAAYAKKVRELLKADPDKYQFDLLYIDGDDTPELIASYPEPHDVFLRVDLYTTAGGTELHTLREGLTAGVRGSGMYYYPRQNVVQLDTAAVIDNWWTPVTVYYQIDSEYQMKEVDAVPASAAGAQPLAGSKNGEEILAVLESLKNS